MTPTEAIPVLQELLKQNLEIYVFCDDFRSSVKITDALYLAITALQEKEDADL